MQGGSVYRKKRLFFVFIKIFFSVGHMLGGERTSMPEAIGDHFAKKGIFVIRSFDKVFYSSAQTKVFHFEFLFPFAFAKNTHFPLLMNIVIFDEISQS